MLSVGGGVVCGGGVGGGCGAVGRSARILAQLATPEFEDDDQVSGETTACFFF
eukprot:COSAG01_NODE_5025_length_4539_cov_18.108559_3_plen_53_part_00